MAVGTLVCLGACLGSSPALSADRAGERPQREEPFRVRALATQHAGRWIGRGISYGPYRDGQRPGGPLPTDAQLEEDLRILARHWRLIRLYGSRDVAENVLQIIRQHKLPLRVLVGAWIAQERITDQQGNLIGVDEAALAANRGEIAKAIELANRFPREILAINVGNETQVFWSDHHVQQATLIDYLRQVRAATTVPITTADDFNFWNKPESLPVAAEVDFIVTHAYAMWGGVLLDDTIRWTAQQVAEVQARHPSRLVVLGETGWATRVHTEGQQAELINGVASEEQQRKFLKAFEPWAEQAELTYFLFEAFDEPWKGGPHPDEVEKHWGLFHVDRTPKAAMQAETPVAAE
jgi:exo-beta-1,3-glucanase (GH17 family)